MSVLANYPNIGQLSAKVNGPWDCVPTSLIDGLEYLTGQHIDIDAMVAAVYGPNWHGATSAARYVEFCAQHGVKLYPIDENDAGLVWAMHQQIQVGHPCLLTEPDVYAPAHPDWSHVLSVYGEAPGVLIARDPFSTHDVTHSDAEWANILEFREIWVMEERIVPLDISMPAVAKLFRQLDANHWQSIATNCILHDAHLHDYMANGQVSLGRLGDLKSDEIQGTNGDTVLYFQFGARRWIKSTGQVVSLDLYNPPGSSLPRILSPQPAPVAMPQEHAFVLQTTEQGAALLGKKLV